MTSGNIDLNGNILTTGLSVANNGTLNHSAGTIINTGSVIGNTLYSSVLAITQGASSAAITVYPVPATDHLTVSFSAPGIYLVELLNTLGQSVRQPLTSTGNSVNWPVSDLPAGPILFGYSTTA